MRSLRALLLILIGVFATSIGIAAPAPPDANAALAKAEAFFDTVIHGDSAKAFDTLLAGSTISANHSEAPYNLRRQLQTSMTTYGKPVGYDLVEAKNFGASLVRIVYILRLEKYPLTWEFFFYRGGDTWMPIDLHFNDRLDVYRFDLLSTASDGAR